MTIAESSIKPFSVVYQITQECPFDCDICLRHYKIGEMPLNQSDRLKMVDVLKKFGVGRICVTGGEPIILGNDLYDLLKYIHSKNIHTCLSTTGIGITKELIVEMDNYLDQLMISIRSIDPFSWEKDFGKSLLSNKLYHNVFEILEWTKDTDIFLEINSVVHKENINKFIEIGHKLLSINSNIVWRVNEYYPIGLKEKNRHRFELDNLQFGYIKNKITKEFEDLFREIRFVTKEQRFCSPEFLITHTGDLVTSSCGVHMPTGYNIISGTLPSKFEMARPWDEHKKVCRDWMEKNNFFEAIRHGCKYLHAHGGELSCSFVG